MIPIQTQTIRVRKWPLVISGGLFLLFAFIVIDKSKGSPDPMAWLLLPFAFFVTLMFLLFKKTSVTIDNSGIYFKNLIKSAMVEWHEISSSGINWHFHGHGSSPVWEFYLQTGKKKEIQLGFYSRKSLQAIAEVLVSKCPDAAIEIRIQRMAEGKFPWWIF